MKVINLLLVLTVVGYFSGNVQAQDPDQNQQQDVCVVSAITVANNKRALKQIENIKSVEIATIDVSRVTEGTELSKTIKIPGTKLYTHVGLFFEDDMKFYDSLTFSMTVHLYILTRRTLTERNMISQAHTHTAFDDDFKQTGLVIGAVRNGKRTAIEVMCRGKKPLDE